jgi:hypothetical protein
MAAWSEESLAYSEPRMQSIYDVATQEMIETAVDTVPPRQRKYAEKIMSDLIKTDISFVSRGMGQKPPEEDDYQKQLSVFDGKPSEHPTALERTLGPTLARRFSFLLWSEMAAEQAATYRQSPSSPMERPVRASQKLSATNVSPNSVPGQNIRFQGMVPQLI